MSSAAEVADRQEAAEATEIFDWLQTFATHGEIQVALYRKSPKIYKRVQVSGLIATYDEPVTDEQIAQEHGGGKFQIKVKRKVKNKNNNPTWQYQGARTFEIAGNPILDNLITSEEEEDDDDDDRPQHNDGPVGMAMNMMAQMTKRAEDRADRAEHNRGDDVGTLQLLLDPMQRQISALQEALASKDNQIIELISKPADNSVQERLLGVMENKESAHGNAIAAIRAEHDSELRQLREHHRDEKKRMEDRFVRELEVREAAHSREVETIRQASSQALESMKNAFEMRIDALKDQIRRLDKEATKSETELVALRAQKEKGPLQQIQGLVDLKNGFEALVPSGNPDEGKSWIERVARTVMESPLAEGMGARLAGAAAMMGGQGAPGEQMVQVMGPDGQVRQIPASYLAQIQAQRAAQAQAEAEGGAPQGSGESQAEQIQLDPADVQRAVRFVESAYRNGTDPETFARSARNMIPAGILAYLKQVGVDPFLNNVAKLEDGSPLATVEGRMFVRRVAKFLLEGTTDISQEDDDLPYDDDPTSPVESS